MKTPVLVLLVAQLCMAGCSISHTIRDVERPNQPPLQELERNLDYQDPDAGQPDYVVE